MRYFYCDESNSKGKVRVSGKDGKKSKMNKVNSRIRLLAKHLYNNSVIELLVHLMELES